MDKDQKKPGLKDFLRSKGLGNTPAKPLNVSQEEVKGGAPPDRVLFKCGHEETNTHCPKCRKAYHEKQVEKRMVWRKPDSVKGRLPDKSQFVATYSAEKEEWVGSLFVELSDGRSKVFAHQASALFRLLKELDDQFREWEGKP